MIVVKKIFQLPIIVLLIGCAHSTKSPSSKPTIAVKGEVVLQTLLAKFNEVTVDTLKVISSLDFDTNEYSFKGTSLDSIDVSLLPSEFSKVYRSDKNFYACFKFKMDDRHTGLIIRTPSMYTPSSIKLFVVENSKDKILDTYIELAETVIQLVEYWDKKTFIIKDKAAGTAFLMWEHQNEDTTEISYTIRFRDERFDTLSVMKK